MNTNPDESMLALWLDDELTGEDLAAVESWAKNHPEQLAAREDIRNWRNMIASAVPASEEPPYPDFFNSRVLQSIRESVPSVQTVVPDKAIPFWKVWLMPAAACAGMALTFWAGLKSAGPAPIEYDVAGAPKAIPVDELIYTPEHGVNAELLASSRTSAIIVLSGVAAIPDSTEFLQTADYTVEREIDSMADMDTHR